MLAAGSTPVKARCLVKLFDLLKGCKLDNDVSKLDVHAAECRLMLGSLLLSPKAKLTVCATEVQADGVPKLQSFMLRRKALDLEAEADDISCFCSKLWCLARCPSPEADSFVDKLPFEDVLQQAGWKRVSFIGKQHLDKLLMLEADHLCFKLVAEADAEAGEARREATSLSEAG